MRCCCSGHHCLCQSLFNIFFSASSSSNFFNRISRSALFPALRSITSKGRTRKFFFRAIIIREISLYRSRRVRRILIVAARSTGYSPSVLLSSDFVLDFRPPDFLSAVPTDDGGEPLPLIRAKLRRYGSFAERERDFTHARRSSSLAL